MLNRRPNLPTRDHIVLVSSFICNFLVLPSADANSALTNPSNIQ
jgi:hypothetical protein